MKEEFPLPDTEWEPTRAANHGIQHHCWMGLNAKEAEDVGFAKEVIAVLPEFLEKPTVLGIGEIGLHKNTRNEVTTLLALIDLAMDRGEQMLFHTPHLEDKYPGTRMILDLLRVDKPMYYDATTETLSTVPNPVGKEPA